MQQKLVTVGRFASSFEAHLAKMRLDANDIPSTLVGEDFANMYPVGQIGFVELLVPADKADQAAKILESQQG